MIRTHLPTLPNAPQGLQNQRCHIGTSPVTMVFETILTKLKLEKTTTNEVAVGGAIGE
jgi:hypothetical protein